MIGQEDILKQKEKREKKKKVFLIAIFVVIGIFALLGLTILILSGVDDYIKNQRKAELDDKVISYVYPDPDYNYNILEDAGYLKLDRQVWFADGASKTVVTDENYSSYPYEIQFMYDVINFIVKGDYTEYNKIFTDGYILNAGDKSRERFTMQQLFEIVLEVLEHREEDDIEYSDIWVSYRIRNNNGTFRNDLDYNDQGSLPLVYRLSSDGTGIKVTDIITERQYYSGLY